MRNQYQRIFEYAATHGGVSTREIVERLYINGATARLSEMRRSGRFLVSDTWETSPTGARYKRFTIQKLERGQSDAEA